MTLLILLVALVTKVGIPVLLIVFLIKGIKYLNKKNAKKNNN